MEFILIVLLILLFFSFSISMNFILKYDILKNKGSIKIFIFKKIPIFYYTFSIRAGFIMLMKSDKKAKMIPFSFNKEEIEEIKNLSDIFMKKIIFKELKSYVNFGVKFDAFLGAMIYEIMCILGNNFALVIGDKLSLKRDIFHIYNDFNKNIIKISFKGRLKISIYDILWSLIESKPIFKKLRS